MPTRFKLSLISLLVLSISLQTFAKNTDSLTQLCSEAQQSLIQLQTEKDQLAEFNQKFSTKYTTLLQTAQHLVSEQCQLAPMKTLLLQTKRKNTLATTSQKLEGLSNSLLSLRSVGHNNDYLNKNLATLSNSLLQLSSGTNTKTACEKSQESLNLQQNLMGFFSSQADEISRRYNEVRDYLSKCADQSNAASSFIQADQNYVYSIQGANQAIPTNVNNIVSKIVSDYQTQASSGTIFNNNVPVNVVEKNIYLDGADEANGETETIQKVLVKTVATPMMTTAIRRYTTVAQAAPSRLPLKRKRCRTHHSVVGSTPAEADKYHEIVQSNNPETLSESAETAGYSLDHAIDYLPSSLDDILLKSSEIIQQTIQNQLSQLSQQHDDDTPVESVQAVHSLPETDQYPLSPYPIETVVEYSPEMTTQIIEEVMPPVVQTETIIVTETVQVTEEVYQTVGEAVVAPTESYNGPTTTHHVNEEPSVESEGESPFQAGINIPYSDNEPVIGEPHVDTDIDTVVGEPVPVDEEPIFQAPTSVVSEEPAPVDEVIVEEPVEETVQAPAEEPLSEHTVEEYVSEHTVEEPVVEESVEETPVQIPAEEPASEQTVEEPVSEQTVEEHVSEHIVEEPVVEETVEETPVQTPAEEPVSGHTFEEPVSDHATPIEEPVSEHAAPVEEPAVEEPVSEQTVEEYVSEHTVEEPVVEEPVEETPVQTPAEEPASEQTVEEPVSDHAVPIEEPASEHVAPVEEPAVEEPVEETPVQTPAEEPASEQTVEEYISEQTVEEPVSDHAVPIEEPVSEHAAPVEETPIIEEPATPVEEPAAEEPSIQIEEPVVDTPVEEEPIFQAPGPVETPIGVDTPVDTPIEIIPDEPAPVDTEPVIIVVDEPIYAPSEPEVAPSVEEVAEPEPIPIDTTPVIEVPVIPIEGPVDEIAPVEEVPIKEEPSVEILPVSEVSVHEEEPVSVAPEVSVHEEEHVSVASEVSVPEVIASEPEVSSDNSIVMPDAPAHNDDQEEIIKVEESIEPVIDHAAPPEIIDVIDVPVDQSNGVDLDTPQIIDDTGMIPLPEVLPPIQIDEPVPMPADIDLPVGASVGEAEGWYDCEEDAPIQAQPLVNRGFAVGEPYGNVETMVIKKSFLRPIGMMKRVVTQEVGEDGQVRIISDNTEMMNMADGRMV